MMRAQGISGRVATERVPELIALLEPLIPPAPEDDE